MTAKRLPDDLPDNWGADIDRSDVRQFNFDGLEYSAYAGDTIASALMANDVLLLSRSFKYHRPRGVLSMAGQDANTLVQIAGEPNCLADRTAVEQGIAVAAQNVSGSLRRDRGRWTGLLSRFLSVGFYYHAFYRPRGIWNLWAKFFRRQAGLGVIDTNAQSRDKVGYFEHAAVVVVGGGRSGLRAALSAAQQSADVMLIDENSLLGGAGRYTRRRREFSDSLRETYELVERVVAEPRIRVLSSATVTGLFADNWMSVVSGNRLIRLRAGRVVLATGKIEQLAVFRNNDLPGILLGTAVQRVLRLYGVSPGQQAVVLAGNDEAYGVALDLIDAGVDVAGIVDLRARPDGEVDERVQAVIATDIPVYYESSIYEAGAKNDRLHAVHIARLGPDGTASKTDVRIACDLLSVSVGTMPAYQLALQAGATLQYDDATARFTVANLPENIEFEAGRSIENHPWPMVEHPRGKEFVDLDEDLTVADILNATKRGYDNIQLVKRYSTCGMGPSQGRHSALPAARLVARATDNNVSTVGVTTARPPYSAESLGHCATRAHYPTFRTAIHQHHEDAGAVFLQAGHWLRPAYYGANREADIANEVRCVRDNVGLIDVSTLGGIEVRGKDASEFLNRMYTFAYVKQWVDSVRYALMTNEAGVVIDDGVACRIADDHFYVTTTTTGIDAVYRKMLQWNAMWRLDVCLVNVTQAWGAINIAGPKARDVLQQLTSDIDLGGEAFPYLAARRGSVAGVTSLLMRIGFVGELGYEIHYPQQYGYDLWQALMDAGQSVAIRPVGIEAQRVLRLEKGHVIVGQDTDAMSTPAELQMDWAIARKKPYFVGDRTLRILDEQPAQRRLVGFCAEAAVASVLREGHLAIHDGQMVGRVTSVASSPTLGGVVGLAFVDADLASENQPLSFQVDGRAVQAEVCKTPFYDAAGERQQV